MKFKFLLFSILSIAAINIKSMESDEQGGHDFVEVSHDDATDNPSGANLTTTNDNIDDPTAPLITHDSNPISEAPVETAEPLNNNVQEISPTHKHKKVSITAVIRLICRKCCQWCF